MYRSSVRVIVVSNPWDIVILGCGQLGGNLKTVLETEKLQVLGVRRTPMPDEPTFISFDLDAPDSWERLCRIQLSQQAVIVTIITPDARTEAAYRERYVGVSAKLRKWSSFPGREHPVSWVSSTAVFGQHQTGILDESVPISPDHWRGELLWEAEQNIAQIKAPTTVIRFAGLYDAKSLKRLSDPVFRADLDPGTVSNRMHRRDAVSWLRELAVGHYRGQQMPALIHGVDRGPATYQQIFDLIDGASSAFTLPTKGRVIATQLGDRMPRLRYPTCQVALSQS
jgi:nucleoside-diphosphate-sugar epimerase